MQTKGLRQIYIAPLALDLHQLKMWLGALSTFYKVLSTLNSHSLLEHSNLQEAFRALRWPAAKYKISQGKSYL